MTTKPDRRIVLPDLDWKTATCPVCGDGFDYLTKRRPRTCNKGECLYRYHYEIEKNRWVGHQPDLFD